MIFGASQPTLALGRQTSNCHVGQDWREELISGSSGLLSLGEAGLPGKLSRSLELLCLVGSLALGLAEHAVPLWAPHLGCLTRLVLYPGGYQALLLPADSTERPHSRKGSSAWCIRRTAKPGPRRQRRAAFSAAPFAGQVTCLPLSGSPQ